MLVAPGPPELCERGGEAPQGQRRIALIPAYNEARFIGSVILQTRKYVDLVLVVDDGSSDTTAETALAAGAKVVRLATNGGKAQAVMAGLHDLQRLHPATVVLIDGDGQHNPHEIPQVLAPIEAGVADMVIGSRFIGLQSDIPPWRVAGQHALTLATNVASGVHTSDSQSGFRAFAAHVLPLLAFRGAGFSIESEMQFIVRENGLRLIEVPISVSYAEPPKRNPIPHAMQVLNGVLRLVGQTRPLLFFGTLGALILMLGLLMGLRVVTIYQNHLQLAIGSALICVLLSIIGTIVMATGVMLHSVRGLLNDWMRHTREQEARRMSLG